MLAILDVTIPFFALVLCGFLAAWGRKLPQQTVAALNGFVLYFALPAMLFRFAAGAPFTDVVNPGVFLSYALTGLAVLFGVAHGLRRLRRDRWDDAAYGAMATAWANWGYMGIALVPAVLGPAAMAPLVAAGMADLLVVVSASLAIASLVHLVHHRVSPFARSASHSARIAQRRARPSHSSTALPSMRRSRTKAPWGMMRKCGASSANSISTAWRPARFFSTVSTTQLRIASASPRL